MRRRWPRPMVVPVPIAVVVAMVVVAAACGAPDAQPDSTSPSAASVTAAPTTAPTRATTPPRATTTSRAPASSSVAASQPAAEPGVQECAAALVEAMTPEQRAGQVLMVGIDAGEAVATAEVTRAVTEYHAGSVFLTGRAVGGSAPAVALISSLQALATPVPVTSGVSLHVAVDQEGGQIQVLRGPGFTDIPAATEQGGWEPAALSAAAEQWAGELGAAGVTMILGPVADVVPAGTANAPIGGYSRQYGSTPEAVTQAVLAYVAGVERAGLTPVLKHFPGLGRASGNTDFSAGVIDDVTTVDDPYLEPFRAGVAAGVPVVMTATATYSQIDPQRLAAFSPAVTDLLRGPLGFDGVIISDDVGKAASVADVPVGQRAVGILAAGGDLVITFYADQAAAMTTEILTQAVGDPAFQARLSQAALRVVTQKALVGLVPSCR